MIIPLIILIITYIGISFTRLPKINIDRPAAAFVGAVLMVLLGGLTFQDAISTIDFHTIGLLLGMMIIIASLEEDGFLTYLAKKSILIAKNPRRLLIIVIVTTGISSAFLVNDAVVLFFTPIIIETCILVKIENPVPYLVAEAMASNVGSVMTITGNPQNMLIGMISGISYIDFFLYLFPVALASILVLFGCMLFIYKKDFNNGEFDLDENLSTGKFDLRSKPSFWILLFTIATFFISSYIGVEISLLALIGGSLALILSRMKPSYIIGKVNWVLLLFFISLFIVIGGSEKAGIFDLFFNTVNFNPNIDGIVFITSISVIFSQIVSNVPLTMLIIPLITDLNSNVLWISLAAGSTLGGNLTLIGAIANLIVSEEAEKRRVRVSFKDFLKPGIIVTSLTIIISILILILEYSLGFLV